MIEIIILIMLCICVYTDEKYNLIKDYITLPLLIIGFLTGNIILSIIGFLIAFYTSYLLYKIGVWCGGDVKLLWGMGSILGLGIIIYIPILLSINLFMQYLYKKDKYPFAIGFLIAYAILLIMRYI